jgi:hypothetical protein
LQSFDTHAELGRNLLLGQEPLQSSRIFTIAITTRFPHPLSVLPVVSLKNDSYTIPMSMPRRNREAFELAGMTDESGHLDRPIDAGAYLVPAKVSLRGQMITWSEAFGDLRTPNGNLLDDFVALSGAPPKQILEFVRKWGPLDVIDHVRRLHYELRSLRAARGFAKSLLGCSIPTPEAPRTESCLVYAAFANHIQQLLNLAAEIYYTQDESHWLARFPYHCEECACGIERARQNVEDGIQRLLWLGEVSFSLQWEGDQWQIEVWFADLVGAIAVKLMLAVARADSLYTCYGCKQAYLRSAQVGSDGITHRRRPRPDQRNYCGGCGRKKALLDAKRRNRQKHRDARVLYEVEGKSVKAISAELHTTTEKVSQWAQKERWKKGKTGGSKNVGLQTNVS